MHLIQTWHPWVLQWRQCMEDKLQLTHMHARTHTHTNTHAGTHTQTHTHWDTRLHILIPTDSLSHARTHIFKDTHTLIKKCTHTHTQTHIHKKTHTHTPMLWNSKRPAQTWLTTGSAGIYGDVFLKWVLWRRYVILVLVVLLNAVWSLAAVCNPEPWPL